MKLAVRGKAPVGSTLSLDEQFYRLVRFQPFECTDGRIVQQMVWVSKCPTCGSEFESELASLSKMPRRRCEPCTAVMANTRVKPGRVNAVLHLPNTEPEND